MPPQVNKSLTEEVVVFPLLHSEKQRLKNRVCILICWSILQIKRKMSWLHSKRMKQHWLPLLFSWWRIHLLWLHCWIACSENEVAKDSLMYRRLPFFVFLDKHVRRIKLPKTVWCIEDCHSSCLWSNTFCWSWLLVYQLLSSYLQTCCWNQVILTTGVFEVWRSSEPTLTSLRDFPWMPNSWHLMCDVEPKRVFIYWLMINVFLTWKCCRIVYNRKTRKPTDTQVWGEFFI